MSTKSNEPKSSIQERTDIIDRGLERLTKEVRDLRLENRELIEDRRNLRQTIDRQAGQIRGFQNQIKSSIVVSTIASGDGDAGALKDKIDEYVKEIDNAIAHLSA